ncbi:MAG: family 78 glycoside hydrolase catalytic domain, partial [Verrucomicrobia bacterium]|nr:family 78 glycoside hydrolase catalytic domain [Verrucomicrobiota bacterium]
MKHLKQTIGVVAMVALQQAGSVQGAVSAQDLRVGEGFREPVGFHDPTPSLSWNLPTGVRAQSAYRVVVATRPELLPDNADLWDSGKVDSDQSTLLPYGGTPVASRQRACWQIRFWDQDGSDSKWSDLAHFEAGLLANDDWQARWIRMTPTQQDDSERDAAGEIVISKAIYGVLNDPGKQRDVTEAVRKLVTDGNQTVKAGNDLAGDPAHGVVKKLRLKYTVDGKARQRTIAENEQLDLATGKLRGGGSKVYVPQYLRRGFKAKGEVERASLYVTAKGLYEVWLNGERVGRDYFAPGWTSYDNRIETLTYDVTASVQAGANAIGAVLGEGWYAGRLMTKKVFYPQVQPALLLQLEITYADGTTETIVTDKQWVATDTGPIRSSEIYDGERYDANRELPGWNTVGFDDAEWNGVIVEDVAPTPALNPKAHAPVRVTAELPTRSVTEPKPGRFVFDLGQNMVGWPRLTMPVKEGQTITIRFAEMLNKNGTLYTANYRGAKSTDFYTAAETGTINWSPTFTFHGFRYVELSGLTEGAKPATDWVTGIVLHSDMRRIGDFVSSHDKLNQLQRNIVWGQRGNFLDIPTDCPQRDERLGWTGDAQAFAPTALFNYDSHAFFKSWLQTMRDDQLHDGRVPHVIPAVMGGGSPGWQDAATIVPWEVYVRTGDREVLANNFEMMERLVGWYRKESKNHRITKINAFGDWLQPYAKNTRGDTPAPLLGTAFYALGADILTKSAHVLGREDDAKRYAEEAATVKAAFAEHYFGEDGKLKNTPETQTAYLLAIAFELIPDALQEKAAGHLVELVHAADDHLRTGFLGTPFITSILDDMGHSDLAC